MDARLLEGVEKFGFGYGQWVSVAAHVGGGVSNRQCLKRYTTKADPALQELYNGPWTDEEFELLKSLVEKHSTAGCRGGVDWAPVAWELGRSTNVCRTKWYHSQTLLRNKSLKKGPFSPEEDAIILAGVAAWDMNEKGLWSSLERELGREGPSTQKRWNKILSQRLQSIEEGESGSKEERGGRKSKAREEEEETEEEERKGKKQKVEASSSSSSSSSRSAGGVEAGKTGEKVKGENGEVEVKVETEEGEEGGEGGEGDAKPSRARAKGSSGQRKACSSTAEGSLKKGPFSPKEDAIILARVAAWDTNEQGLWIALERELGWAASNILARWTQIITMIRESAIEEIGSKEERRRLDWERKTDKAAKAREEEAEAEAEAEALARVETEKEGGRKGKRQKVEASSSSASSRSAVGAEVEADTGAGVGADAGAVLVEGDLSRKGPRSLFKGWLKSKQMRLKKLTEQEKGEQFRKFVKRFNKHKLPDSYYLPGAEEAGGGEAGQTKVTKTGETGEKGGVEVKEETEEGEEGGEGGEGDAKPSRARAKGSSGQKISRTSRAEGDSSGGMFGQTFWTDEMDARLLEGVEKFGRNWVRVAAHMGEGLDRNQCTKRYTTKVDPALQDLYNGPWTDEEFELLKSLVEKHATTGHMGGIDWVRVGRELGRSANVCRTKWYDSQKLLRAKSLKKGPFSPEEDAIIVARVAAWDTNKQGLWSGLERELGRRANVILIRWKDTLSKR
ncbi:hypothetical protein B484DRAFT_476757 [Ochromonadaceae sp. CCMP2298]|nr:hypothetical protein B484DRAFT_476757 [Ochromonadaceae sp. CCMP2298]